MKRANFKIVFLILFCNLFLINANAQQWNALGEGVRNSIADSGDLPAVYALFSDSGYIYASGIFDSAGDISASHGISRWNGTSWSRADSGVEKGEIFSFAEYNGTLYSSGWTITDFDLQTGFIALWNGQFWKNFSTGFTGGPKGVNSLMVYDSLLIAAGQFDSAGITFDSAKIGAGNIAAWNGSVWSSIGNIKTVGNYGLTMAVYKGKLIVAGLFGNIDGILLNNIAQWDGNSWSALESGINGAVLSLTVIGDKLYAGGLFDSAGANNASSLAVWNDTSWAKVSGEVSYQVYTLANDNGNLIIGGALDKIGSNNTVNYIAEWNGSSWFTFDGGIDGLNVYSILANNGNIYVGGTFSAAGGIPANNIARWGLATGINTITEFNHATVYPNPGNGQLTIALATTTEPSQIDFYNLLGEKVYHSYLNSGNTTIDLGSQPSGLYLYRVYKNDGELVGDGKYVLE